MSTGDIGFVRRRFVYADRLLFPTMAYVKPTRPYVACWSRKVAASSLRGNQYIRFTERKRCLVSRGAWGCSGFHLFFFQLLYAHLKSGCRKEIVFDNCFGLSILYTSPLTALRCKSSTVNHLFCEIARYGLYWASTIWERIFCTSGLLRYGQSSFREKCCF